MINYLKYLILKKFNKNIYILQIIIFQYILFIYIYLNFNFEIFKISH